jgi:hypothetical protein
VEKKVCRKELAEKEREEQKVEVDCKRVERKFI